LVAVVVLVVESLLPFFVDLLKVCYSTAKSKGRNKRRDGGVRR